MSSPKNANGRMGSLCPSVPNVANTTARVGARSITDGQQGRCGLGSVGFFGGSLRRMSKEELLSAIGIVLILWYVEHATGRRMLEILWEHMPALV